LVPSTSKKKSTIIWATDDPDMVSVEVLWTDARGEDHPDSLMGGKQCI